MKDKCQSTRSWLQSTAEGIAGDKRITFYINSNSNSVPDVILDLIIMKLLFSRGGVTPKNAGVRLLMLMLGEVIMPHLEMSDVQVSNNYERQ